jgi:predicted nucleic acid-binding protein
MIVDASVAFKLIVAEPGTDEAMRWLEKEELAAPALMLSEVANGLWKRVRRGELDGSTDIEARVAALTRLVRISTGAEAAPRALRLAIELDHPVYDCLYLALAEANEDRLLTADAKLARIVAGTEHAARVEML